MTVIDLKSLLDSGHFNLKNIKEMGGNAGEDLPRQFELKFEF